MKGKSGSVFEKKKANPEVVVLSLSSGKRLDKIAWTSYRWKSMKFSLSSFNSRSTSTMHMQAPTHQLWTRWRTEAIHARTALIQCIDVVRWLQTWEYICESTEMQRNEHKFWRFNRFFFQFLVAYVDCLASTWHRVESTGGIFWCMLAFLKAALISEIGNKHMKRIKATWFGIVKWQTVAFAENRVHRALRHARLETVLVGGSQFLLNSTRENPRFISRDADKHVK